MGRYSKIKILGKYSIDKINIESIDDKEGFFVEDTKEPLFQATWDLVCDFSKDGYAPVMENEHWGFINSMGELVIPYRWKDIGYYSNILFPDGLCSVQDDNYLWGFIDERGNVVIPCQWADCRDFHNGRCVVKDGKGVWSYIDVKGNTVQTTQWKEVGEWSKHESLLSVQDRNGLWGFVDERGELVIPCKWLGVDSFSEGLCAVKDKNNLWGAINVRGILVVPAQWDNLFSFNDGEAFVTIKNHDYYIDKRGKVTYELGAKTSVKKSDYKERAVLTVTSLAFMFFLFSSMGIGYADYNSICAYSLLDSSKCLGWFVAFLGGLHIYDLILPFVFAAGFVLKRYFQKSNLADFKPQSRSSQKPAQPKPKDTSDKGFLERLFGSSGVTIFCVFFVGSLILSSWCIFALYMAICFALILLVMRIIHQGIGHTDKTQNSFNLTDGVILFLLVVLPIRVIYYPLFSINYFTACEPQPTEKRIISEGKTFFPGFLLSKDKEFYYLIIDVDDGVPYKLSVNISDYYNSRSDMTSKVFANIRKGCFGYSFVSDFKTEKTAEE